MILFLNVMLAVVWAGLLGSFDVPTFVSGFVLGYLALFLVFGMRKDIRYFTKPVKTIEFISYYLWELICSNIRIAIDIVTPEHRMKSGIIAIPLAATSDFEITLLANLITMTPGTMSLDVSPDRKTLYVHAMYVSDPDALRAEIKNNLEARVLALVR